MAALDLDGAVQALGEEADIYKRTLQDTESWSTPRAPFEVRLACATLQACRPAPDLPLLQQPAQGSGVKAAGTLPNGLGSLQAHLCIASQL